MGREGGGGCEHEVENVSCGLSRVLFASALVRIWMVEECTYVCLAGVGVDVFTDRGEK